MTTLSETVHRARYAGRRDQHQSRIKTFCCNSFDFVDGDDCGRVFACQSEDVANHVEALSEVVLREHRLASDNVKERCRHMMRNRIDQHGLTSTQPNHRGSEDED